MGSYQRFLSEVVESIDIINAQGELSHLTPADELFHMVTGGLGLFGIVTKVKLKVTSNVLLKETGVDVPLDDYPLYFREQIQTNPDIRMHLYRLSIDPKKLLATGVAVNYMLGEDKQPKVTKQLKQEPQYGTRLNRFMVNLARRFNWVRTSYWQGESKRLLANESVPQTINEIMQPPINALMTNPAHSEAEWLQEYFLPEETLANFVKKLGALLTANEVCLLNASIRFTKQNEKAPLSYAQKGDRFAVVLCFNQSLKKEEVIKARKWLREAQHMAVEMGGSFYLPYQHVASPEDFEASYPGIDAVRRFKELVDPNHLFWSGFAEKYLLPGLKSLIISS